MGERIDDLRTLIQSHPIIDNHAHNLLSAENALDYDKYPLESITSEAQSEALKQAPHTLSHRLAVKQLATLFACEPAWEAIKAARHKWIRDDYQKLVRKCLDGTYSLLLDDLLADCDIQGYKWHDQFTGSALGTKRIVRIEAVASKILHDLLEAQGEHRLINSHLTFISEFQRRIDENILDSDVVGFKSVICYRTGLDIHYADSMSESDFVEAFGRVSSQGSPFRIADKPFNDYLVRMTLDAIQKAAEDGEHCSKPIQFHTGLGDNDINLVLANPAYMQPLIAHYPNVNFVLLHSSYPYTREAGYLASVYPNVYLDLGEVYSMVSKDAELSILRQSMELAPTSRLLWSTDGHFHPETFWLSNKQFRDSLETVLVDYVQQGTLTLPQAKEVAMDILFNNSNRLYNLKLSPPEYVPRSIEQELASSNPKLMVWMQWVDYTATIRVRMFPIREFIKIVRGQRRVGLTLAVLYQLEDDMLAPGGIATGQFYLRPDLSSFCRNVALGSNSATVMTFWEHENGDDLEGCPRTTLQRVVTALKPIEVTLGFEIEVVFLQQAYREGKKTWEPITKLHSWSNMTSDIRRKALRLLEEIVTTLASIDIYIEQFHAESGHGQFEFILPPTQPLAAVDILLKARQTIVNVAEKYNIRATLHPRPDPHHAGTASHTHFSISPTAEEESFLAGILAHFPSITAFSLPQQVSYERVTSGVWAGSEWITWGTQNRETPIRKVATGHWELKQIDGLANMYLAVVALLAAGYSGITNSLPLTHKDCGVDASTLSESERKELGITTQIPKRLEDSLVALENDDELSAILGTGFVEKYISVKRAEAEQLAAMNEDERRTWLIERY